MRMLDAGSILCEAQKMVGTGDTGGAVYVASGAAVCETALHCLDHG